MYPRSSRSLVTSTTRLIAQPRSASLKFAVRSGGHSPETSFSTIQHGLVVDLSLFNEVSVPEDKKSVAIGTGARWFDVSTKLDSMNLEVAGGRDSKVGVGGLLLGGGFSFFSPRVGLACDNVIEYQVVLANRTVTNATPSSQPDLWLALKGRSNNFGIVTRFVTRIFTQGKIWGDYLYQPIWKAPQAIEAFHTVSVIWLNTTSTLQAQSSQSGTNPKPG